MHTQPRLPTILDKIVGSALEIIEDFLTTEPSLEERHQRRVNKIINYEKEAYNEL